MTPAERVLAYFDRISEAPDAIPRLRRFILDLAVQGRLVDSNPGEARQEAKGSAEGVFTIPAKWSWTTIGDAARVEMGQSPPSDAYNTVGEGLPFYQGKADFGPRNPTPRYWCTRPTKLARENDILISVRAPVGPTNVATETCCIGRGLAALRPDSGRIDREFLLLCLRAFEPKLASLGFGTTFIAVNKGHLVSFPIPLPPLAEQHLIVAKVDELMALCDRLEAAQKEQETRRDRLSNASLARLRQPSHTASLRQHAGFQLQHIPRLTTTRSHIQSLRETILILAVRGLLAMQDPRELSDVEILDGSERDAARSSVESGAHHLPIGWSTGTLANVVDAIVDCPHSTPKWTSTGKLCVRTNQFRPGRLDLSGSRFVSESTYLERIVRLKPVEDDILYSREGGILAVACRIPAGIELCLGQRMMLIRSGKRVRPAYLEIVLNSPLITAIAKKETTGGAAPRINVATVKSYPIPVPPIAEQQRVVDKVNALMVVCDRLETELEAARTAQVALLESTLREVLIAGSPIMAPELA